MSNIEWQVVNRAARMLKVMAHPDRIRMVELLVERKILSVGEIQKELGLTQSMTSQHLAALRSVGVAAAQKNGNVCHYRVVNRNVLKLLDCVKNCAAVRQS